MKSNQRRRFLVTTLGACGLPWTSGLLRAANGPLKMRYSVTTPEGLRMLAIYAGAVATMTDTKKFPEHDPRSWLFQWYTHAVRSDRTKSAELARVFTPANAAARPLAEKMWETCEAHRDQTGLREPFFLPWHRMYVLCFEQIVRAISGNAEFTLPYWDYTDPGQRGMPKPFWVNDAQWKALYRKDRDDRANKGDPIDVIAAITRNALRSGTYEEAQDGDAGFCANVDGDPHGAVHVDIGNGVGMRSVAWAASDPVFWIHHCNIDRLWASWNKAGGKNLREAGFLAEKFTFADGKGNAVELKVQDYLEMPGYEYDSYVSRPPGSVPFDKPLGDIAVRAVSRKTSGRISLGSQSLTVPLTSDTPGAPIGDAAKVELRNRLKTLPPGRDVFLRIEGIRAPTDPGTAYDVHVTTNRGGKPDRNAPSFLGSINFFGLSGHHASGHGIADAAGHVRTVSFVLGKEARELLRAVERDEPQVTLVPTRPVRDDARPTIENISLIAR
jgi:tyrosinase